MDASPFNKLSGELRNRIYEFVLILPESILMREEECCDDNRDVGYCYPRMGGNMTRHDSGWLCIGSEGREALKFLATCRQIRQEALSIFFGRNVFETYAAIFVDGFLTDDQEVAVITDWGKSLGHASAKHIRHMEIKSSCWYACRDADGHASRVIPSMLKELRKAFVHPQFRPKVKLYLRWSAGLLVAHDGGLHDPGMKTCVLVFGNAEEAKKEYAKVFANEERIIRNSVEPEDWNEPTSVVVSWRREDLRKARRNIEQLISSLREEEDHETAPIQAEGESGKVEQW